MAKKAKKSQNISHKVIYGILAGCTLVTLVAVLIINNFAQTLSLYSDFLDKSSSSKDVTRLSPFVNNAVLLIERDGEKAFDEFRKIGKWRVGDLYIFVYDMQGNTLVLPPTPNIEGTNRWNTKDANGVYFVREMIQTLEKKDSGWITYDYPKPGEASASPKLSYFKKTKIGDKNVMVGSGVYLE